MGFKHFRLSREAFKAVPKGAQGLRILQGFLCDVLGTEGAQQNPPHQETFSQEKGLLASDMGL